MVADDHLALIEANLVRIGLGRCELLLVVLRGDLVLLAGNLRGNGRNHRLRALRRIVKAVRNLNVWNDFKWHHHLIRHAVLLTQRGLVLEIHQTHVVIRRIRRHRRHHPRALAHRNRQQRQSVDDRKRRQRRLERQTHEIAPLAKHNSFGRGVAEGWREALEGHVTRSMLAHDCHLVLNVRRIDAVPCIGAVLFVRQHPAVGLAVHGLGSEV